MLKRMLPQYMMGYLLIVSSSIYAGVNGNHEWAYQGANSLQHWSKLDKRSILCNSGQHQSPIDIQTSIQVDKKPLTLNYQRSFLHLQHDKHNLTFYVDKQALKVVVNFAGTDYQLMQFHLHHPGEHLIAGKRYAAEIHFVHQSADQKLTVLAVLIKQGRTNPEFAKLLTHLPSKQQPFEIGETVNPAQLMPKDKAHYEYQGSLTTPPCSENVQWLVMAQPIEISKQQLTEFAHELHGQNARPVQRLHE